MRHFILFLLIIIGFHFSTDVNSQKQYKFKTIVLDAGHGGKDPGAVGKTAKEKDIVLAVCLKVGKLINENYPNVKVVYTRSTDVFVPLDERANIANKANADLFISIHANSIPKPSIVGTETFVLGLHKTEENLAVAKKENSVITYEDDYTTKYEGFDPNSPESYIIFELMQNVFLDQSIEMAHMVQESFTKSIHREDRGVKQAGFLVLRRTSMPSILIELGFISNREEEKFLSSADGQNQLASSIYNSFKTYKTKIEGSSKEVKVVETKPIVTETKKEEKVTSTKTASKDELVYRIQIKASPEKIKLNSSQFSKLSDVWEYQDGKMYKYTTGYYSDFNEVKKALPEVKKVVADAFIVGFVNNKRVKINMKNGKLE